MGRNAWWLLGCVGLGGCEQLEGILDVKAPKAALNRLDLTKNPSVEQMAGWGCEEFVGQQLCDVVGLNKPNKTQMQFSFDIVFDLTNPNDNLPIPLVETLLGFTAFDAANLGSICVSFCDPEVEDCAPSINAVGACDPKGANDVDSPEDLIPSVEDLLELGEAVAEGELDNGDWRVIKGGQTLESHIQFDLGIDPFLDIADELVEQAVDDFVSDRPIKLDIPFTAEGTLFFDVPELGREAIGFGPFDDVWTLK
jgi:hypothetical protein